MAKIRYDSELMTNYVSAVAVPPGSHFVNCLDPQSRRAMVFALSNDAVPKLQVIKEDENGNRNVIDLSKLLHLSVGTPVQAFDVQQAPDLTIYLTFATPLTPLLSTISVVKPFQMTAEPELSLYPSVSLNTVQSILIGTPPSTSSDYPMILACHQPLNRIAKGSDISRIFVNPLTSRCEILRDLALPVNATAILDIAPAASIYGKGIFVLYVSQSVTQLLCEFVRPDPDGSPGDVLWYTSSVSCPEASTSIATFFDARGYSALIIGHAKGLQYLNSSEAINKNRPGKLLSSDPLFNNIQSLTISQDSTQLSFWFTNQDHQLGYSRTTTSLTDLESVLLLEKGQASAFSASISKPADPNGDTKPWQSLIAVDETGNLNQLQQCTDTGIWHSETFYVSSDTTNVPIQSYTITIQAFDDQDTVLGGGSVTVTSSSSVNVILNGKTETLSTVGKIFPLDPEGELAFIVSSAGIATQTLKLTQLTDSDGNEILIDPVVIDPSRKVIQAFNNIKTGKDLANAKTKDKKPLFDGVDKPSQQDLDQAATCFQTLIDASNNLPADGTQQLLNDVKLSSIGDSFGERVMDGFHWVKEKVHEAYDWVVNKIGTVWQFVCTIAGEVKSFVLDCIEKVGEAFSWVWSKIKLGIDKLIQFAGFLFNWDDILHTKDVIAGFLNAGTDYAIDHIKDAEKAVDSFFDKLEGLAGQQPTTPVDSVATKSTDNSDDNDTVHSTSYKWSGERVKNGGMGTSSTTHADDPNNPSAENVWKTTIQPALDKIHDDVANIASDIQSLFHKHGGISTADIFKKLGTDVLTALLDTLRLIVKTILASIGNLLSVIKSLANAKINIPVFSALYSLISKHDLTVVDAISLIVAIPATILIKLVTGKPTPDFGHIDQNTFAIIFDSEDDEDDHDNKSPLVNGNGINGHALTHKSRRPKKLQAQAEPVKASFATVAPIIVAALISIKSVFSMVRILYYKLKVKDNDKVRGTLDTRKSLKLADVGFTAMGAIFSLATLKNPPGESQRGSAKSLTFGKCLIQAYLIQFDPADDRYNAVGTLLDMVMEIINFSLNCSIYEEEIKAKDWEFYDKDSSNLGLSANIFNFLAMASKFATVLMIERNPEGAVVPIISQSVAASVYSILSLSRTWLDYNEGRVTSVIDPAI